MRAKVEGLAGGDDGDRRCYFSLGSLGENIWGLSRCIRGRQELRQANRMGSVQPHPGAGRSGVSGKRDNTAKVRGIWGLAGGRILLESS